MVQGTAQEKVDTLASSKHVQSPEKKDLVASVSWLEEKESRLQRKHSGNRLLDLILPRSDRIFSRRVSS